MVYKKCLDVNMTSQLQLQNMQATYRQALLHRRVITQLKIKPESAGIFILRMKWQNYEKVVKNANCSNARRVDIICIRPPMVFQRHLEEVLLLIKLKNLICRTFQEFERSRSLMASMLSC